MSEKIENIVFTNQKLTIKDAKIFLSALYSEDENESAYKILRDFAYKQKSKIGNDIPSEEYDTIINMALVKAKTSFTEDKAAFQSYFFMKLRGEISLYRSKILSTQNKIIKLINNNDESNEYTAYEYQKSDSSGENSLELVDHEDLIDKLEQESYIKRQFKAFKIAFSGIPRDLQNILNEVGSGKSIKEVSLFLNLTPEEVSRRRNSALSLILQRVLRSNHLYPEEKKKIMEAHSLSLDSLKEDKNE